MSNILQFNGISCDTHVSDVEIDTDWVELYEMSVFTLSD